MPQMSSGGCAVVGSGGGGGGGGGPESVNKVVGRGAPMSTVRVSPRLMLPGAARAAEARTRAMAAMDLMASIMFVLVIVGSLFTKSLQNGTRGPFYT